MVVVRAVWRCRLLAWVLPSRARFVSRPRPRGRRERRRWSTHSEASMNDLRSEQARGRLTPEPTPTGAPQPGPLGPPAANALSRVVGGSGLSLAGRPDLWHDGPVGAGRVSTGLARPGGRHGDGGSRHRGWRVQPISRRRFHDYVRSGCAGIVNRANVPFSAIPSRCMKSYRTESKEHRAVS